MAAASGSVQSVERTLDILEALSGAPFGLLLTELAAATGLHVSTAHRLVNVLVERGYATKESGSGKYRLTLRTFAIGSRVSGVWDLLSAARPYLERLASLSQEAVHLVERDGNSVVYLYKAEPFRQLVRMGSHTGLRNPMYCTGVGKSILAQLRQELDLTRSRGYAVDDEEHEAGVRCIAVAIRNWAGEPVAAVSISAPAARLNESMMQKMLPQLQNVAMEISRMLGFHK